MPGFYPEIPKFYNELWPGRPSELPKGSEPIILPNPLAPVDAPTGFPSGGIPEAVRVGPPLTKLCIPEDVLGKPVGGIPKGLGTCGCPTGLT
jgi:hypothetical protein